MQLKNSSCHLIILTLVNFVVFRCRALELCEASLVCASRLFITPVVSVMDISKHNGKLLLCYAATAALLHGSQHNDSD